MSESAVCSQRPSAQRGILQVPQKHKTKPKPTSMNPVVPFLRPAIIFFTVTSHSHNPEARRCSSLHQSSSCTSQPSYAIERTISHKVKEKELHHCFLVFALFLLLLQKDLKSILCLGYTSGAKSATTQLVLFLIRVHASAFTVNSGCCCCDPGILKTDTSWILNLQPQTLV